MWAREDVLARLDGVALQAFDRMLRVDEEPVVVVGTSNHEDEDADALANPSQTCIQTCLHGPKASRSIR